MLTLIVPLPGIANEQVVVDIAVNGASQGDFFIIRTGQGDLLVREADCARLGLATAGARTETVDGVRYVSVKSVPDVRAEFDEKQLRIDLVVPTLRSPRQVIDFRPVPLSGTPVLFPQDTSVFMNYGVSYSEADPGGQQSLTVTNRLGIRSGNAFFTSDARYVKTDTNDFRVRLMSTLTVERRRELEWFVAGDMFASSGELGSTVNLGGVGLWKVTAQDPYYVRHPTFNYAGSAALPSTVEVYMDGALVRKVPVQPGDFEIRNLDYYGGDRNVDIVIRDPFGQAQKIRSSVYFSNELRAGVHEYRYHAGFLREQFGIESNEYGKPVFSGFHRYGISDRTTVGARGEAGDGVVNLGAEAVQVVPRAGTFTGSVAESRSDGARGAAGSLGHVYQKGEFTTTLQGRLFTRDYAVIGSVPQPDPVRTTAQAGAGYTVPAWGVVSIGYQDTRRYSGSGSRAESLVLSKRLSPTMSLVLSARASRTAGQDTNYDYFVVFNYSPSNAPQMSAYYQHAENYSSETVQLQQGAPTGEGYGYRAALERADLGGSQRDSFSPFVQYNGRYGVYTLDGVMRKYGNGDSSRAYTASAAGSVVYAGGFWGLSRPVNDSFALVFADALPDIPVLVNNVEISRTGREGIAVLPTLQSYRMNQVSLAASAVPMEYTLSSAGTNVFPGPWSGACVSFDVEQMKAFTGRLVEERSGKRTPLEFYEITMQAGDRDLTLLTGRGGEFYFENTLPRGDIGAARRGPESCRDVAAQRAGKLPVIAPGRYPASVEAHGSVCEFTMVVPDTGDAISELGEVVCAPSAGPAPAPQQELPAAAAPALAPTVRAAPRPTVQQPAEDDPPRSVVVGLRFDRAGDLDRRQDRQALASLVRRLEQDPLLMVAVEVHGDRHGSERDRARLGAQQAAQLRRALVRAGVPAERIASVEDRGVMSMLCSDATAACDRINRRAVIRLVSAAAPDAVPAPRGEQEN